MASLFFLVVFDNTVDIDQFMGKVERVIDGSSTNFDLYKRQIEAAADKYEESTLPPFFKALADYVEEGNSQFDCPGHQGGQFYCKHPAGRAFYDFYGENVFRSDLCNAALHRRLINPMRPSLRSSTTCSASI